MLWLVTLVCLVVVCGSITWDVEHALECKGKLDDAMCDVSAVEDANSQQLYRILQELSKTTYFRLMHINLDGMCHFFNKAITEAKCTAGAPPPPPIFGSETPLFSPISPVEQPSMCSVSSESAASTPDSQSDRTSSSSDKRKSGVSNKYSFEKSFLKNPLGFMGEWGDGDTKTSPVVNPVDRTISKIEEVSLRGQIDDASCTDPSLPDFWLDMCSKIPTNASEYVNLELNPERWTGYNGSHVWNAIYNENCFAKMGDFDEMCYEERVLYRLLSGMHTSVNIHISLAYNPPSKAKNRTEWTSSPQRFMEQYGNKPEYLKNLYFSFVVLLRALRRAGPYIYNLPFTESGSEDEARHTQMLVRRLLDSGMRTHI